MIVDFHTPIHSLGTIGRSPQLGQNASGMTPPRPPHHPTTTHPTTVRLPQPQPCTPMRSTVADPLLFRAYPQHSLKGTGIWVTGIPPPGHAQRYPYGTALAVPLCKQGTSSSPGGNSGHHSRDDVVVLGRSHRRSLRPLNLDTKWSHGQGLMAWHACLHLDTDRMVLICSPELLFPLPTED